MNSKTLSTHINFRVPQVSREFLDKYTKLHNISLSWLLRLAIKRVISDIENNGMPLELTREQMRVKVQSLKYEAKRLRVDAYEKMSALSWSRKQEEYKELRLKGTSKDELPVEYKVVLNMSDAHFNRYGDIQHEIIALSNEIEDTYKKEEDNKTL